MTALPNICTCIYINHLDSLDKALARVYSAQDFISISA